MDEDTSCLGDVVDSRAVVGLGERNLLLSPGAVIMYANGATMEAFREFEVLWWVLLDDYLSFFIWLKQLKCQNMFKKLKIKTFYLWFILIRGHLSGLWRPTQFRWRIWDRVEDNKFKFQICCPIETFESSKCFK